MTPSKVVKQKATSHVEVDNFYLDTVEVQGVLDAIVESQFPKQWKALRKAHKAGKWSKHDYGPYLGHVLIWKLPSWVHLDGQDEGPTITFPNGFFERGYMDLLDFDLRFLYSRGHVMVGWTCFILHRVSPWTARITPLRSKENGEQKKYGLTPGRIGVVAYFPNTAYAQLHDKPPGWGKITKWGVNKVEGKSKYNVDLISSPYVPLCTL